MKKRGDEQPMRRVVVTCVSEQTGRELRDVVDRAVQSARTGQQGGVRWDAAPRPEITRGQHEAGQAGDRCSSCAMPMPGSARE